MLSLDFPRGKFNTVPHKFCDSITSWYPCLRNLIESCGQTHNISDGDGPPEEKSSGKDLGFDPIEIEQDT